jgi:hypothetical protein
MTDPLPGKQPVPLTPPAQPITGDSHHHLIAPLSAHAAELGYGVEVRDLPEHGTGGWCDPKRRQIVIANGPANQQVRTLTHELAHAHGVGYEQYGREQAEVLVDCVTYIVCSSVGLDVGGESIPYIAGWGEDGALDAIREYAQTIDTIARRIEAALDPKAEPTTVAGSRRRARAGASSWQSTSSDDRRATPSAPLSCSSAPTPGRCCAASSPAPTATTTHAPTRARA